MTTIIDGWEQWQEKALCITDSLDSESYSRQVMRQGELSECFSLKKGEAEWLLSSSYFIGVDWLDERNTAIRILPKFTSKQGEVQINYLAMLEEALKEPKNLEHLEGLLHVDYHRPSIQIPQQDDGLSLFLVSEYLNVLAAITRKGLKKAYYQVEENVCSKVKGKLLVSQNIKKNNARGDYSRNYSRHQEYGIDIPENQLLKKALLTASHIVEAYEHGVDMTHLKNIIHTIKPKWNSVSTPNSMKPIGKGKTNTFFKEYPVALHLARLILQRVSVNQVMHGTKTTYTPPYWIDMSKLFEMYVLRILRQRYGNQVEYHHRFLGGQEPDYLLYGNEERPAYIVDAKYKRYGEYEVNTDDIRQVSGYCRLKTIRKELGVTDQNLIRCVIIYPDLKGYDELPSHTEWKGDGRYEEIYKVGIRLPLIDIFHSL